MIGQIGMMPKIKNIQEKREPAMMLKEDIPSHQNSLEVVAEGFFSDSSGRLLLYFTWILWR